MSSSLKLINLAQKSGLGSDFRLLGHRTTYIPRILGLGSFQNKAKRTALVSSFKTYTEKVLPRMEETIEVKLLRDRYNAIEEPLLKNELLLAYRRRQLNILELKRPRDVAPQNAPRREGTLYEPMDIYIRDILNVTEFDIGKIVEFPDNTLEKYFPIKPLGDYYHNQYRYSSRFCLQCTEEAFKLTNEMRKISYARLTEDEYKKIFAEAENSKEFRRVLDDEELFPRIFHDFAITFNERLELQRKDTLVQKMFSECYLFDALVNILVRELVSNSMRPHLINKEKRANIIDQIIEQLKASLDEKVNPQRIQETLKPLKNFKINLGKKEDGKDHIYLLLLKKYALSPRSVPSGMRDYGLKNFFGFNSGAIVTGTRGAGKSGLLMYAVMWAHKNNWVVVNPPDAYYLTQERTALKRHHDSGLYLEFSKAQIFLKAFREANLEVIKDMRVNLDIYGKFNSAGVHDNEPEPVPVTYNAERKYWSNDWEKFLTPTEKLFMQNERRELSARLKQRLPEPKVLLELVDQGLKDEIFSINAIYEILEQLYNSETHKVLVAVDNYNYFFLPTCYPSFRYANEKGHESIIPAHHLALSRAFMKFDGHRIKNGMKIVASGLKKLYKHSFTPKQINMGLGYTIQLNGLPFDDYVKLMDHLKQANVWGLGRARNITATEKMFLESQGNYFETLNAILKPLTIY